MFAVQKQFEDYGAEPVATDLQEADAMAQRPKMGEIYTRVRRPVFPSQGAMDFDDLLEQRTAQSIPGCVVKYKTVFDISWSTSTRHQSFAIFDCPCTLR